MIVLKDDLRKIWAIENEPYAFGGIVYRTMNSIWELQNLNESETEGSEYRDILRKIKDYNGEICHLADCLERVNDMSISEKYELYQRHKFLSYRCFGDGEIDVEDLIFPKGCYFDGRYVYRMYDAYDVTGVFVEDLFELLFNPKEYRVTRCANCKNFFTALSGHFKYCDDCRQQMGRIQYKRRKNDKLCYLVKRIQDARSYKFIEDELVEKAIYFRDRQRGVRNITIIEKFEKEFETFRNEEEVINAVSKIYDDMRIYKQK